MVTEEEFGTTLAREVATFQPMISAALDVGEKMGISSGALLACLLRTTAALALGMCGYDEAETRRWVAEGMDLAYGDIFSGLERSRDEAVRRGMPVPPEMDEAIAAYKAKVAANG